MKIRNILAAAACLALVSAVSCSDKTASPQKDPSSETAVRGSIVFKAEGDVTDADLDEITRIFTDRALTDISSAEQEFTADYGSKTVTMTFSEENTDEDKIKTFAEKLCEKRLLEFRRGDKEDDEVVLTNSDVAESKHMVADDGAGGYFDCISLKFNEHGTEVFADLTDELTGTDTPLSVWFDGELITAPLVNAPISDGNCIISGDFTTDEASYIASRIDSEALPYQVSVQEINY